MSKIQALILSGIIFFIGIYGLVVVHNGYERQKAEMNLFQSSEGRRGE